ncbi:DUF4235 domain-containing protein [Actinomadura fibrosa]|uniref:DUF4235 domain-containing protein n=1 Tax=Actinomadura fibrosa TaxID=111802 RepID=A0ABW2XDB1_9ACTN|nr:DUF4235 domain-containing protein [Actinomadura fibrosa]
MVYKVLSIGVGILGGQLAGVVFKQVWKRAAGQDDAPDADDRNYPWWQVMAAAALQGAIFGLVKAALQRTSAHGVQKATGRWPGDD